jgi:NAD(P)-dependent dehydrogenase (short-subunit alcohol dehydrogenase family)
MSHRLTGRTALITGGTTGIGFATAKLFLAEGARVAFTGKDLSRIERARNMLGSGVVAIHSDARLISELPRLAAQIESSLGHLDVLFLNAGISPYSDLAAVTEVDYDEIFTVNTKAAFFTIQHLVPLMRPDGSIIITTSITNRIGMPRTHVYAAAKAASASFARTLAGELAARGIRVNALSPGAVDTEVGASTGLSAAELQTFKAAIAAKVPLRRFAQPDEIARAALFLASSESSYMTGQEMIVDGGWLGVG